MNNTPNTTTVFCDPACDHAIVLAAKRGDERAFGILFERYQPRIFAVALRYTRVAEDAEDVVQQTFQKAFLHLHQFEGKSSFSSWLTRIAINEALMVLRRRHALRQVALDDLSEGKTATHSLEIPDPGQDPEAKYLKRERTEILLAAIAKLTIRSRIAIELREFAELSTRETARCMGVSVGTVKARVFQGRRKLRRTLGRLEITPKRLQRSAVASVANRTCVNSASQLR
jgi:RNA polymerase sigma-70 factor, ECF subfamily